MALNGSGPISLAGATAGQSIAVELSLGATSQISLNDTAVRTLAGVTSGAITMPTNFWGKSAGPSVIGQAYGGGYYAGKIAVGGGGVATHYLIVCDVTVGQAYGKAWKTGASANNTGANSDIDGPSNSSYLAGLGAAYQAAVFCEGINTGGYTDWYMPAKNELEVMYFFLKPTSTSNSTSYGSNPNAVAPEPISTNYTSGTPAISTSASFAGGAQSFSANRYWCSTQSGSIEAKWQLFSDGTQFTESKFATGYYTRACRRIPI